MPLDGFGDVELRALFDQFDADKSGSISDTELGDAMRVLGVKISPNSAKRVLKMIDTDCNGTIEWPEFRAFFNKVQDPEDIKALLSAQNQRFFEYKVMVDNDPQFARMFKLPKSQTATEKFARHNESVVGVNWLSDSQFASGSIDGEVHIWELTDQRVARQKPVQTKKCRGALYCMDATSDGQQLICGLGSRSQSLWMWNINDQSTEEPTIKYEGYNAPVYSCRVLKSSTSGVVVAGLKDGTVVINDLMQTNPVQAFQAHEGVVHSCDLKDNGKLILTASADGHVKIFDISEKKGEGVVQPTTMIEDAATSGTVYKALFRGQHEVITCGDDYCIKRFDIRQPGGTLKASYLGHTSTVRNICLSPEGDFLASVCEDGSLRLWLVDELSMIQDGWKNAVTESAEIGRKIASMEDEECGTYALEDWKAIKQRHEEAELNKADFALMRKQRQDLSCTQACLGLDGHKAPAVCVSWGQSKTGLARILSGSRDEQVNFYEVDTKDMSKLESWVAEDSSRSPSKAFSRATTV